MRSDEMAGRLGLFQRLMIQWNDLHAYNAVHAVRVARPLEADRLRAVVAERLERLGLTGLVVDRRRRRFHFLTGPSDAALKVLGPGGDPLCALEREIEAAINTPFSLAGPMTPFRFVAVPADEGFFLAIVYAHFIADATPMVGIVADLAGAYGGAAGATGPLDRYRRAGRLLAPIVLRRLPRWTGTIGSLAGNLRRATKPRYVNRADTSNHFRLRELPSGALGALTAAGARWGATINDLCLAALIRAVAPLSAERLHRATRRTVAVTSIASVRRDLPPSAARAFGLFLGNFTVFHPAGSAEPFAAIVRDVQRQTVAVKRHRLYLRALLPLLIGVWVMPKGSPDRQQRAYRQYYPLWGGLTNLNLDGREFAVPRPTLAAAGVRQYLRAVSTGPLCPLVFAVTTYGGRVTVGVSYRPTVFSDETLQGVAGEFLRCLSDPERA